MKKALFIAVEGIDGSGKGTLIEKMKTYFAKENIDFVATREPGGTPLAEKIREIVKTEKMDTFTEALLFASARRDHVQNHIKPALCEGKLVLCDRFIDSSLAYQGVGRKMGINNILDIHENILDECMPDITIYLDIHPEIAITRLISNKREMDRLDLEDLEFYHDVRQGYLFLAEQNKENFIIVDATKSADEVFADVKEILKKILTGELTIKKRAI